MHIKRMVWILLIAAGLFLASMEMLGGQVMLAHAEVVPAPPSRERGRASSLPRLRPSAMLTRYVAITGTDTTTCITPTQPCRTLQYAVDMAASGDLILVATGTYTDLHARQGITQMVYLTKSLTIRGGYKADFSEWDPDLYTTTLDAQSASLYGSRPGRVFYIAGDITAALEGLEITGGSALDLGGGPSGWDAGHGLYVVTATLTISRCSLHDNFAYRYGIKSVGGAIAAIHAGLRIYQSDLKKNRAYGEYGGALYLESSTFVLEADTFDDNYAPWLGGAIYAELSSGEIRACYFANHDSDIGGALYLDDSAPVTLEGNTLTANHADDDGGALYLSQSTGEVISNTFTENQSDDDGGAVRSYDSEVTIAHNFFGGNASEGVGGAIDIYAGSPVVASNTFTGNQALSGGALYIVSNATLRHNSFISNTAYRSSLGYGGYGGAIYVRNFYSTIDSNFIAHNRADTQGGGMYVLYAKPAMHLDNNIIVSNVGVGGVVIDGDASLRHNTFARNEGFAVGTSKTGALPTLTNTIIAGETIGITATAGTTVTLEGTLWGSGAWANGQDWDGAGSVQVGSVDLHADPAFVAPDADDYHIALTSPAVNQGVSTEVSYDFDDDPRPAGSGVDIGADETEAAVLQLTKSPSGLALNGGRQITHVIRLSNPGIEAATNVRLTDTLPAEMRLLSYATSSSASCTVEGTWGTSLRCDLGDLPSQGEFLLTTTAQVTTTLPAELPKAMINTVHATGDNVAPADANATTYFQDCHVRINGQLPEYEALQEAADAAQDHDTLQIAGVCAGVEQRHGTWQALYLDRPLNLRGGYRTDFGSWDPRQYTTTLNLMDAGRAIYVNGSFSLTLESLLITRGYAGDGRTTETAGGGLYATGATLTISDCHFRENRAGYGGGGAYLTQGDLTLHVSTFVHNSATLYGGGLLLERASGSLQDSLFTQNHVYNGGGVVLFESTVTLERSACITNSADVHGGGLYAEKGETTIRGCSFNENFADSAGGGAAFEYNDVLLEDNNVLDNVSDGIGGGLAFSYDGHIIIRRNTFRGNRAPYGGGLASQYFDDLLIQANTFTSNHATALGGGLGLFQSSHTIEENTFTSNTAEKGGGGLYVKESGATIRDNRISYNHTDGKGGGVYFRWPDAAPLLNNTVTYNSASELGGGFFMYRHLLNGSTVLDGNLFAYNSAPANQGGGLYLHVYEHTFSYLIAENNVIASNQGGGIHIAGGYFHLRHNTLARNEGTGIWVTDCTVWDEPCKTTPIFTDTILVGHTIGISVSSGMTATMEATLWGSGGWANGSDTSGSGSISLGSLNLHSEPGFVNPDADDYHLLPSSAAVDAGVDAGLSHDMDGDHCPSESGFDIGADEYACNPPVSATIQGPTSGYVDSDYPFTATVSPPTTTTPIAYTWAPEPQSGQGSAQATYRWPTTGTHTITVTLSNCGGSVTATHTITITEPPSPCPVPLTGVSLAGPTTGYTGTDYTFDATIAPADATVPITYTWAPAPQSGQGTAQATHNWPATGTYTLTVTAQNCGGVAVATRTITITERTSPCPVPLTSVSLAGPTNGYTSTDYTFNATIAPADATAPITYTWAPAPQSGQGTAHATYNWPATGTYTLTVTAQNCGGTATATHTLRIIPHGEAISIVKQVSPTGTVAYGDPLTYTLVLSADADRIQRLYDPLSGTTFLRFIEPIEGITHTHGLITGTATLSASTPLTLVFLVEAAVPLSPGASTVITNRACLYPPGGGVADCLWSNTVTNPAIHPHRIYLPLVLRNH